MLNQINLTGVLSDGYTLYAPMIQPISITILDNYLITLNVIDSDGYMVDLTNSLVIFTVKPSNVMITSTAFLTPTFSHQAVLTNPTQGICTILIGTVDTQSLLPSQSLEYDVVVIDTNNNFSHIIPVSPFNLQKSDYLLNQPITPSPVNQVVGYPYPLIANSFLSNNGTNVLWLPAVAPPIYYQQVQSNKSNIIQQNILNFSSLFTVTNDISNMSTDVTPINSGVTPGTYQGITVDIFGRVTSATSQGYGPGTVTGVATDSTLTGGPITSSGTLGINLSNANTWSGIQTFSSDPITSGLNAPAATSLTFTSNQTTNTNPAYVFKAAGVNYAGQFAYDFQQNGQHMMQLYMDTSSNGLAIQGYQMGGAISSGIQFFNGAVGPISSSISLGNSAHPWYGLNVGFGTATLNLNSIGTAQTVGTTINSTTAAQVNAQQYSPVLELKGSGWKTTSTAASETVAFGLQTQPVQGTTAPTGLLNFMTSINGAGYSSIATLDSSGNIIANGLALTVPLPVSSGGSGVSTTSQSFVFIGPTSGSGAPSLRALVTGDLPSSTVQTVFREAITNDTLLTTTNPTTSLTFTPTVSGQYIVNMYYRVVNGTTGLTATLNWTDSSGAETMVLIPTLGSFIVGTYSVCSVTIYSLLSDAITLVCTAGTANNILVSASIVAVE